MKSRRSIRLREYDYSQNGLYFVTICVDGREELLGNVENGEMVLNNAGKIVDMCIHTIPEKYENIDIDSYIIMPNHIHIIIAIVEAIHELPEKELDKIRHYININPAKWEMDRYNKICEGEENKCPRKSRIQ